jgi:hypothetical protein
MAVDAQVSAPLNQDSRPSPARSPPARVTCRRPPSYTCSREQLLLLLLLLSCTVASTAASSSSTSINLSKAGGGCLAAGHSVGQVTLWRVAISGAAPGGPLFPLSVSVSCATVITAQNSVVVYGVYT